MHQQIAARIQSKKNPTNNWTILLGRVRKHFNSSRIIKCSGWASRQSCRTNGNAALLRPQPVSGQYGLSTRSCVICYLVSSLFNPSMYSCWSHRDRMPLSWLGTRPALLLEYLCELWSCSSLRQTYLAFRWLTKVSPWTDTSEMTVASVVTKYQAKLGSRPAINSLKTVDISRVCMTPWKWLIKLLLISLNVPLISASFLQVPYNYWRKVDLFHWITSLIIKLDSYFEKLCTVCIRIEKPDVWSCTIMFETVFGFGNFWELF